MTGMASSSLLARLRRHCSLPLYLWIQLGGILAFVLCVLRYEETFANQGESLLPYTYIYTGVLVVGSYVVSYWREALDYLRNWSWEQGGESLILAAIVVWGLSPGDVEGLSIAIMIYALLMGAVRRRIVMPSAFQWAGVLVALYPLVAMLWTSDFALGWIYAPLTLLIGGLGLVSGCLALDADRITRMMTILFRIGFGWMTLQILCYLTLSHHYLDTGLLSFLTLEKYYTGGVESPPYLLFMPWAKAKVPAFWMLYLSLPLFTSYLMLASGRKTSLRWGEIAIYWLMLATFCLIEQPRYGFGVLGLFILMVCAERWVHWVRPRLWLRLAVVAVVLLGAGGAVWTLGLLADPFRWSVYAHAVDIIRDNLPLGLGTGMDRYVHMELFRHEHSHNSFLTAGVDAGLIGLGALLLWVLAGVWTAIRQRNYYLAVFLLLLIPLMCLESPLYMRRMARLIAIFVLLLGGNLSLPRPQSRSGSTS